MKDSFGKIQRAETLRLFFAIKVPENLIPSMLDLQKQLRGDWRPVAENQFHITLLFMGHVLQSEVPAVLQAGEDAAKAVSAVTVSLRKTDCFPNARRPRVLVIHVESDPLTKVANTLRENLTEADFDKKPFKGHLTIARAKGLSVKNLDLTLNTSWQAHNLELIQSTLTSHGARYQTLRVFPFGCPPSPG